MKKLTRDFLFRNYGDLSTLPAEPPLSVSLGESFVIETVDTGHLLLLSETDADKPAGPMAGNPSTGPVYVEGIKVGDVIAVTIEDIRVVGHCGIGIGEGTLLPEELVSEREDFIRISDGIAHFPGGLTAQVKPMFGCFGVVPAKGQLPEPWHHGGNLDLPDICAGSTVHIRCQRDGAYFCCGDGHAIQGDGEINGYSLEVSLEGVLRIEKSPFQDIRTMVIETEEKFVSVGVERSFADSIKSAEYSMADFLAKQRNLCLLDAYQLSSHIGDIRVGPVWLAVREDRWKGGMPIPACVGLSKEYFK